MINKGRFYLFAGLIGVVLLFVFVKSAHAWPKCGDGTTSTLNEQGQYVCPTAQPTSYTVTDLVTDNVTNTNKNVNKNANTNANQNTNVNAQQQGQVQGQQQGQSSNNVNRNTANGGTGIGVGVGGSAASDANAYSGSSSSSQGGSASAQGGSATGGNSASDSHNVTTAKGGEVKDSGNSEATGGAVTGNTLAINNSTTNKEAAKTAYAPTQTIINSDNCDSNWGAGGQGFAFGFSIGGSKQNDICERLKLGRELVTLGFKNVAVRLLRGDSRVDEAFKAEGL